MKQTHKTRDLAAALALALVFPVTPVRADDVTLKNVTIVDVVEGRLVRGQVVRIAGADRNFRNLATRTGKI